MAAPGLSDRFHLRPLPGAVTPPGVMAPDTSGPSVSVEGDVQLAHWNRRGEDAPVEIRGDYELESVSNLWRPIDGG
jgi:hypothetical protein